MSDISADSPHWDSVIAGDIPLVGLQEALRNFSGRGSLLVTLANMAHHSLDIEREWSAAEVLQRARRILFSHIEPIVATWPKSVDIWVDSIPVELTSRRTVSRYPVAGTSWRETRRRGPWPPREFHGRTRLRSNDEALLNVLGWTLSEVKKCHLAASALAVGCDEAISVELGVARDLQEILEFSSLVTSVPNASEIAATGREGSLWHQVAKVAEKLLAMESSVDRFALELLMPDPIMRGLLFHLAVLGVTLRAATDAGLRVRSVAPLNDSIARPNFILESNTGKSIELWFEGGGAWRYHRQKSPYTRLSARLPGNARPISPDLLLLDGSVAVSIECKYSNTPDYIRKGIQEALAYASDISGGLLCKTVESLVLIPDSNGHHSEITSTATGSLGLFSPAEYGSWLTQELLSSQPINASSDARSLAQP
jgi:hypothetical protein